MVVRFFDSEAGREFRPAPAWCGPPGRRSWNPARAPEDTPRYNHHQILIVDPNVDLDQPDFRSSVAAVGVPNKDGGSKSGTFSSLSLEQPGILAHELLHLAGLDDRYHDVYSVGGKEYTLPFPDPSKAQLTQFAKQHNLPPPPTGKIVSRNNEGTTRCDVMGTGAHEACRKLSKRDVKIIDSRAGVSVVAQPGDLLLNKNAGNQNYGGRVPHDGLRRPRVGDHRAGHLRLLPRPRPHDRARGGLRRPRAGRPGAGL